MSVRYGFRKGESFTEAEILDFVSQSRLHVPTTLYGYGVLEACMKVLTEEGGICVCGQDAMDWYVTERRRWIHGAVVTFDPASFWPEVVQGRFQFPSNRGQLNYVIHLLEGGDVLVVKDNEYFLCTKVNGKPVVIHLVPSRQESQAGAHGRDGLAYGERK